MKPSVRMLRCMKQRSDAAEIPWPVFAVTVAAAFMVALDLSIVNVAFPSIKRSFPDVSTATLSWVLAAYSVVFGALLLGAGRIADRSGRRRIFLLGLLVFTARLAAVRHRPVGLAADRRAGRAGRRRRAAHARVAGAAADGHPARRPGRRRSPCGAASRRWPSPPARRSARC